MMKKAIILIVLTFFTSHAMNNPCAINNLLLSKNCSPKEVDFFRTTKEQWIIENSVFFISLNHYKLSKHKEGYTGHCTLCTKKYKSSVQEYAARQLCIQHIFWVHKWNEFNKKIEWLYGKKKADDINKFVKNGGCCPFCDKLCERKKGRDGRIAHIKSHFFRVHFYRKSLIDKLFIY